MRKEGKGGVTFDSDEALLASPSNELVNSGILGGAKKTKIVLTNANVGSQPMTLDGETYGSYREITSPLPESRHLHSTHHTTMYGGSQVPFRASPRSSHDSPAGGSHPGSRRGSHYSPEAFVVPIHGNSGSKTTTSHLGHEMVMSPMAATAAAVVTAHSRCLAVGPVVVRFWGTLTTATTTTKVSSQPHTHAHTLSTYPSFSHHTHTI